MFKELTYKKKNMYLFLGALLFLVIAYTLAFKKTALTYREYTGLKEKMVQAENAPLQVATLQRRLSEMERVLSIDSAVNIQQALLGVITAYCQSNHLILREIPETIRKQENDLFVETNVFVVEGDFIRLLKLTYLLEQKSRIGKIASLQFRTKKDFKTKRTALTVAIYLQTLKKSNET